MMTLLDKINGWHPILLNIFAVGISLTDIEVVMKIIVLTIAGGYSSWKWYSEYKKSKRK